MKAILQKTIAYCSLLGFVPLLWAAPAPATLPASGTVVNSFSIPGPVSADSDVLFDADAFKSRARNLGISVRESAQTPGVRSGLYLIAGVFREAKNQSHLLDRLRNKGLQAGSFSNPENGLRYVYAGRFDNPEKALQAAVSGMDGAYGEKLWILINGTVNENVKTGKVINSRIQVVRKHPLPANTGDSGKSGSTSRGFDGAAFDPDTFGNLAKSRGIAVRQTAVPGLSKAGFYIVAGVYRDRKNLARLLETLRDKGLQAGKFTHPDSGLHYAFAARLEEPLQALEAAASGFEGVYGGKLWILVNGDIAEIKPETPLTPVPETPIKDKENISGDVRVSKSSPLALFDQDAFMEQAKSLNIPTRVVENSGAPEDGIFLITGVFSQQKNIPHLVEKLRSKGLAAGSFTNPENGLHYIYADRYDNADSALEAAGSGLNGTITGDLWLLVSGDFGQVQAETAPRGAIPGINRQGSGRGNPSKLIQKANHYFEMMWYADAAKLYEEALSRGEENTFEIIRKAGDSHYFNTDMERAYYWYDQLYERYRNDMSAASLFRYAHALKGNGKYGRARRIMRLYEKKSSEGLPEQKQERVLRETLMDNILDMEGAYGVKNLDINSRYSEFGPAFYGDRQVVFASSVDSAFFHTRRYKWNDQPYLDLYVARMNEDADQLNAAVKFSKKLNTKYHEAGVTFSPDRQTIFFTRNNYGKKLRRDRHGVNHLKLYMSRKVGGQWSEAEELPFNGEDYSTGHPALSPDGKKLYFVSDMPGSIGQTDIFVVDVLGDGKFSEPRNLGPEINTEQKEMFPFVTREKLYFSSDGHVGLGGLDVFEVSFTEEEGFLEVQNMGQPINSKKDDFSYIVDEDSQKGFFASNRPGGKGDDDLYSFQRLLPEESNSSAIAGVVVDLVTGEAIPEALVTLLDENNRKLKEVVTDGEGSFVFQELEGDTHFKVTVEKADYQDDMREVATLDQETVSVDISMRRLHEMISVEEGVRKLKTEAIYFDFDKHNIRPDAAAELDKLVAVMNEHPTMVIAIESHTDSRGPREYNRYLSQRRAKSTREYLISRGIDPARIERATGYGEDRLLNGCDGSIRCSSEQHQLNRRSEFIIVRM